MGACKPSRLVSREGIEPSTRGLKVPCSTTELPARLLEDFIRQCLGALSSFYTPGKVEGYNERYHERRQHSELHEEVGELVGTQGLFGFGGYEQDAPDDGDQADEEERLGDNLALPHDDLDGVQVLDDVVSKLLT